MKFEWNDEKNNLNVQKHQVSFEEAKEVFLDPMHISKLDHRFDYFEERWITLGTRTKDKILVVANMFFDENGGIPHNNYTIPSKNNPRIN